MAKKRTAKYWKKRAVYLKKRLINRSVEEYEWMAEQYEKAAQNIQREIEYWYARFAENNEISLADAKKLLTSQELKELKWDVEEYIEKGRTLNYSKQWAKELENASARAHISRYEALQLQMQQQAEALYGGQLDGIDNMLRDTYQDGYYRTAYEVQKGFGVGWNFAALDERRIEKALARPWGVDGKNFSSRVWENKTKLIGALNKTLTQSIIRGEAPDKAIKEISRVMEVDKRKAGRLVMTESAFIASESQKDCYKELGVEYFEVLATLDSHTCSDCGVREGQKIPMSEYESGVTAPPFHPYCRCCTVPAFDDEFDIGQRVARDGNTGKTYYIPDDMNYQDWKETFVDGGDKSGFDVVDDGSTLHYKRRKGPELKNSKESVIVKNKWNNDLPPHGQLDFIPREDELYSFVAKELNIPEDRAMAYTDSVMAFTDDLYSDIRAFQRGEIFDDGIKEISDNIEEYIKKAPRWNGGITYRGISMSDTQLAQLAEGYIFNMGGTSSWSDQIANAQEFASRHIGGEKVNSVIFHCETQGKGTAIKHLSVYEHESEVLCSKESRYIVEKIEGDYGIFHIYLKEVD